MIDKSFPEALWNTSPSALEGPSNSVQGKASFDASRGITLDIPMGTLLDHTPVNGVITYGDEPLQADCIYGCDRKGSFLIITDVHEAHRSMSCPGYECQTLWGRELMASKKPIDPNPHVSSFAFGMTGLREWVGVSPTSESFKLGDGNRLDEMTFKYAVEDVPDVVLLDKDGVKVTVDCLFTAKGGQIPQFEFGFATDYKVTISFEKPLSLREAFELWVLPIRKFLAFCMGFYGRISSMGFSTEERLLADYYIALAEGDDPTQSDLTSMPLRWPSCSDRIASMLDTWLGFEGYAKEAASRVVSLLADWRLPLELRFLATAQAFEAVTRVGADLYELPAEEFERRKSVVASSVEEGHVRKWAKQKLRYANYKTAGSLAAEQVAKLGVFADYLVPNRERFLIDHRQTRNYNTHLDSTDKPNVLHGSDLLTHGDATYLLLYASICMLMGFEPSELLELIKKSRWKSDAIFQSRRQYKLDD